MPTETTIKYATDFPLSVSAWDSDLASQLTPTSAIFDNSAAGYMDVTAGGFIDFTGTSAIAGDSIDIYVTAQYSDTPEDMGGAIDALLGEDQLEVADVSFIRANLKLIESIALHGTPATAIGYHWSVGGIAAYFNGILPKYFMFLMHANTASSLAGSGTGNVNIVGITFLNT